MPKTVITPPGTSRPSPPSRPVRWPTAIVYVSGTLAFDKDNNVAFGDAEAQTRRCWRPSSR
jgi:aminoacrylate peracid reductase